MYNLQPRAAAATSDVRASSRSDVQIFTVKLATASAIPPGSPEVTKRQRGTHSHLQLSCQTQRQSQKILQTE